MESIPYEISHKGMFLAFRVSGKKADSGVSGRPETGSVKRETRGGLLRYPVVLDLRQERFVVDFEEFRGAGFVASGDGEGSPDDLPFGITGCLECDLFEWHEEGCAVLTGRRIPDDEFEILRSDNAIFTGKYCPADDIL